jgi:Flp pilus assembly protein TadG
MNRLRAFGRNTRGGTAVETALVLPAFVLLVLGSAATATVGFSVASLHFAVQEAARCAAVKTTVCTNSAAIATYGQTNYAGLPIAAVFTYSTSPCAHTVSATGTLASNLIPQITSIPISATACYP